MPYAFHGLLQHPFHTGYTVFCPVVLKIFTLFILLAYGINGFFCHLPDFIQ